MRLVKTSLPDVVFDASFENLGLQVLDLHDVAVDVLVELPVLGKASL